MGLFDSFGPPRKVVKVITEPHWFRGLNHYQAHKSPERLEAEAKCNRDWECEHAYSDMWWHDHPAAIVSLNRYVLGIFAEGMR